MLKKVIVFYFIFLLGCNDSNSTIDEALSSASLNCKDGAQEEFRPWGKNGRSLSCQMKHGKFIGWDNGYKMLEGQYRNGEKIGVWYWYDKEGNAIKNINYDEE